MNVTVNDPAGPDVTLPWQFKLILIAGAFGGIFPCLVRVALAFTQGSSLPVSLSLSYWIGAALLALLGGGVAWIFDEGNAKKAFFLGLGLPSFLQLQLSENIKSLAENSQGRLDWFIASAVAQVPPTASAVAVPGRVVHLTTSGNAPVEVSFTDTSGRSIASYDIAASSPAAVLVPDTATQVVFGKLDATHETFALPHQARTDVKFDISVQRGSRYGILQALGARPDVSANLQVKQIAVASPGD